MTPIRQPRSQRFRVSALIAVILIPVLLLLVGTELIREFGSGRVLRAEVNRSYETRFQIQRVFSLLQDAETGVRGYILTGDEQYLEPYASATAALDSQEGRLADLFAERQAQSEDFARLQALSDRKLAILAAAIEVRREQDARSVLVSTGSEGKIVMDDLRDVVRRMVEREAAALDDRSDRADRRTARTEALVAGLFVALLSVVLGTALLTWRYMTARQKMLSDLEATASRQQVIFDSAIDTIITLNPSGSIETVNAAGERMFGYTAAELTRRDVSLLIDIAPDGDGEFLKRLGASQGALTRGLIRQMEGTRRSGETFPVDVALGAMQLPTGVHVVAVVRDISERRRIEQLKDEFVSTVSHELRTPLTSIAGSLGLLSGGAAGPLPEKAARLIQIAQANSQRLVRLINDILDIEKIESGKLRLEITPLDLREIAERSIEGVQGYARDLGVTLSLADNPEEAPVRGDADRLIQVVTNLLSNASKFSPAGGVVTVTVDRETRVARLSVIDQGPGIPDTFRARIFAKFAQADSSDTRAKGGTGLGLAIAREIAERHGGRLWFESAPGEGATFHLDLPLADPAISDHDNDGPRLLIVEDDPDAAEILREMLERDGFAADIAGTCKDALAAVRTGVYAAALVDLQLPDADGISFIRALRADPDTRAMPVVVVSADTAHGKARGQSLEVIDWLEKPVDQSRLRAAVAAIHRRTEDGRPLVLHVDDDRDILEVTAAALADAAEIVPAESLAAARLALTRHRPDLVILDLGLPDGSGLELLTDLRDESGRTVPVIVYSAQEMDAALANRVEAVLTKSRTSLASLTRTVRRLTDGKKTSEKTGAAAEP